MSPTCAVLHEVLHYLIFELRPFICGGFRLSLNRQIFSRLDDLGQARGYGHITQQYLIFGRTTGGQHFQLEYLQRYLKNCFASFIL